MTTTIADAIEGSSSHLSIQQFMQIPEHQRQTLATNQPSASLTLSEYEDVIEVARQIPLLHVERAFFKVLGERYITPSALVQLVVKARIIPPGSTDIPPVDQKDLEDLDPEEGDLDALLGRQRSGDKEKSAKMLAEEGNSDLPERRLLPPLAYAPYFPRHHSPRWHIFLSDSRMGKIAVPPFTMTTFDKPLSENGRPTFNIQSGFPFSMQ